MLFLHGIGGTSKFFILSGPVGGHETSKKEDKIKSLPYQLVDSGEYDVWFLNARGNFYSKSH